MDRRVRLPDWRASGTHAGDHAVVPSGWNGSLPADVARSWMPFKRNPDGSLDLYFKNASPGADKEANWLPAPKGPFSLTMRLHAPKSDALTGKWNPPAVMKAAQPARCERNTAVMAHQAAPANLPQQNHATRPVLPYFSPIFATSPIRDGDAAMRLTLAQHAAPLLITTMLVAAPAWAQTTNDQSNAGMTTAPSATNGTPSGTSQKAVPHTSRAAMARQPGESMQNLVERRIADLHSRLHITSQQSQQWEQFTQVMRDNAKEMDDLYRQRAEKFGSMTAVDNMQSFAQIEQQRAQDMQKLVPAFQTLYGSLSDQQKKTADQMFRSYSDNTQVRHHAAAK